MKFIATRNSKLRKNGVLKNLTDMKNSCRFGTPKYSGNDNENK